MKRFVKRKLAAMCVVAVATAAVAQDSPSTPEEQARQLIETRQGLFKLMNWSFAPIAGMLRNRVPFDASVVQTGATRIEQLAPLIPELYRQNTSEFRNIKTRAREGIWSAKDNFDSKAQDLVKAAAALKAAAQSGDRGQTLRAAGAVGKACGSCHDSFRID